MEANRYRIVWIQEAQRKLREIVAQASSRKRQNNGSTEGLKKIANKSFCLLLAAKALLSKFSFDCQIHRIPAEWQALRINEKRDTSPPHFSFGKYRSRTMFM